MENTEDMETDNNNDHLGIKHKEFNKQVQDAITSQKPLEERELSKNGNDLDILLKIDIASHNKDIDYVISVLKSDDMLYVSRAIKQSPWIVDDQYSDIINPEFLKEKLFPFMKTKASIKLLKHVRHYLKNEKRVEEFYKNEPNDKAAAKWLSRCSIPFIEENVSKHMSHITNLEFKRLCERSVTIFEVAINDCIYSDKLKAASFLLHTYPDRYLDVFENINRYGIAFGPATTALLMKKVPDRIIKNFPLYVNYIHLSTFIENLKREQIQGFLFNFANQLDETDEKHCCKSIFEFRFVEKFVERIPKEQQFEFVKKVFLDIENIEKIDDEQLQSGTKMFAIKVIYTQICRSKPVYRWYKFAPFNVAFNEIKKIIESEKKQKYLMYHFLIKCADNNTKDLLDLLKYYSKNSLNDNFSEKMSFINQLISQTGIYKTDQETWQTFADIINSLKIYTANDDSLYTQIIILRDILQNKQVTVPIEHNHLIIGLEKYRDELNYDEQNKVFDYIYKHLIEGVERRTIETERDFSDAVDELKGLLDLLLNWDKELADFPFVIEKIKDLIRIRKDNSWKFNMSSLYNKKKSWRRLMFEDSIVLNPTQDVFINALKHEPGLLTRYKGDVDAVCCNDAISLKQLLRKLRIYWPDSLADTWTKSYFERLDKAEGHKALTRGLCLLLTHEPLLNILKKFAPEQPKIDWNNTNEVTLGLQRSLAKNMHIARPQPTPDDILLYAKGDYLQYALPSLSAIYYNLGRVESEEHIPKLLNAPVSLQKHGLRFAFIKLKHEELKFHLCNMWQASKNISIRAVTFGLIFEMMCKEEDLARMKELWEILDVFIDNLSFKEDKKIYEKLLKVNAVPDPIQPMFLVKCYKFLKTLLPHLKIDRASFENGIQTLAYYTRSIMELMCPEFVANIITEHLEANFCKNKGLDDSMLAVTSSYLLCAKDLETQNSKYEKVLVPVIKRAINQWNETYEEEYYIRRNFQDLLRHLYGDLERYIMNKEMVVPTKMFQNIQKELDVLPVPQNYIILRMWKLVVKVTEMIEKNDKREDWKEMLIEMAPQLGILCLEILKEDVKAYFPCIYVIFEKVLQSVKNNLPEIVVLKIYEVLLSDKEFTQAYLLVLNMLSYFGRNCYYDETNECVIKEREIKEIIHGHSSVEVKMHYYSKYSDQSDCLLGK